MTFQALYELYIEDMSHRLRQNSIDGKKNVLKIPDTVILQRQIKQLNSTKLVSKKDFQYWKSLILGYFQLLDDCSNTFSK